MKNLLADNERALWILKTKGPQPVCAIAKEMDITTEGARFHLLKLEKDGLVQSKSEAEGRGRPRKVWSLTEAGHNRFPDRHADMTANLITLMRDTLGSDALGEVIEAHQGQMLAQYQKGLEDCNGLESRIAKLAEIRNREGYMAEYRKDDEGYLLLENHCPICTAAKKCQGFCRAELQIFKKTLGDDVEIKRTEHIIKGARRCAYRIISKK